MEESDRERWRGGVDARLDNLDLANSAANLRYEKLDIRIQLTELAIARIATKIGMWAAGGAILGGGIVSMVFQLLIKK